jgi:hypothetical protein
MRWVNDLSRKECGGDRAVDPGGQACVSLLFLAENCTVTIAHSKTTKV